MSNLIGQDKLATDTISRQAAIDAIKRAIWDKYTAKDAIDAVCNVPSAERKKGKWVRIEDENGDFLCWECSECGDRYVMPYHRASYCPNCGAEMRGEEG